MQVELRHWPQWEEPGLTGGVAPVGGIVVTVPLLAVSMAAVFRTDQVRLLERRAATPTHGTPSHDHSLVPVRQRSSLLQVFSDAVSSPTSSVKDVEYLTLPHRRS